MFRYKIFCLLSIIVCCLFSCKKKIVIPLPNEPAKPTLNAFMNQDSIIYARATLSGRINFSDYNNNDFITPENTVVKLYEDDMYIETLHDTVAYNRKYFISNKKMEAGKSYRLTAEMPGYAMAEGTNIIPDRNDLIVSDKKSFMTHSNNDDDINFNLTLTNRSGESKRYRFRLWYRSDNYYIDQNGDTIHQISKDYLTLESQNGLSILDDNYGNPYIGGIYSIQPLKPGESRAITLKTSAYLVQDVYHLELSVLTEDAYQYLSSLNNVLKNNDDPTAEKQNVICNVKNGFGIVGGVGVTDVVF